MLLRGRRRRALRLGPETFLLDRVAEDLADRLRPYMRSDGVHDTWKVHFFVARRD